MTESQLRSKMQRVAEEQGMGKHEVAASSARKQVGSTDPFASRLLMA